MTSSLYSQKRKYQHILLTIRYHFQLFEVHAKNIKWLGGDAAHGDSGCKVGSLCYHASLTLGDPMFHLSMHPLPALQLHNLLCPFWLLVS